MEKRSHLQIRIALLLRHRTLSEGVLSPSLLQLKSIDSYRSYRCTFAKIPLTSSMVYRLWIVWWLVGVRRLSHSLDRGKNRRRVGVYYGVPGPMELLYSRRMQGYCWQSVFALLGPVRAPSRTPTTISVRLRWRRSFARFSAGSVDGFLGVSSQDLYILFFRLHSPPFVPLWWHSRFSAAFIDSSNQRLLRCCAT